MSNGLSAKSIVITGAGSGIGLELALLYGAQGYRLALADINTQQLESAVQVARDHGATEVLAMSVNVASEPDVVNFANKVVEEFTSIDIVINNAGVTHMGTFEDASSKEFQNIMDINFGGVVYGCRAFIPALKRSCGSLVNISSLFGFVGVPFQSAYCASKFAVRGLTEALRVELKGSGIHVACVHPGGVRTNIARNAVFDGYVDQKQRQQVVAQVESTSLKMPAKKAAEIIRRGIEKRKSRILIGRDARLVDYLARVFPSSYPTLIEFFMSDN